VQFKASVLIFFTLFLLCADLGAEDLVHEEYFQIEGVNQIFVVRSHPMVAYSETVYADSLILMLNIDYNIDYKSGKVTLLKAFPARTLKISYLSVPEAMLEAKYQYQRIAIDDSLAISKARIRAPLFSGDNRISISGAKTFAISFSDDEAFSLKQSLFVNLNGELSSNVFITAQLSDSQSKLTPEGDSKELSNLDQVFFKVFGKEYEIAMGDLEVDFQEQQLLSFQSKYEGVGVKYSDRHQAMLGFSAANGKRASAAIEIIDGKQGPYYLKAGSDQQSYMLIAGSERIFVDAELQSRGIDYSIDYADGTVTFLRLVTSNNRVVAYFQYSDEYYKQNMYLSKIKLYLSDRLYISHHGIWQRDNKDNPLQISFTASDLDSLRNAGDNNVWGSGVSMAENGVGSYRLLTDPEGNNYYEYAAGDSTAVYNVIFSYVGQGSGSYDQYSSGKYRYVGFPNGAYIPQKRLIPPLQRVNITSGVGWNSDTLEAGLQAVFSSEDKNTYSKIDDHDNLGLSFAASSGWKPDWDNIQLNVEANFSLLDKDTYLFGEADDIQSDVEFGTIAILDSTDVIQADLSTAMSIAEYWFPKLSYRYQDGSDSFRQHAFRFQNRFAQRGMLPELGLSNSFARLLLSNKDEERINHYHFGYLAWKASWIGLRCESLLSSSETSSVDLTESFGVRYQKLSPQLSLGKQGSFLSTFVYTYDQNETKVSAWKKHNSSQTFSLRHVSNSQEQAWDVLLSRRVIKDYQANDDANSSSAYDLVSINSSSQLWQRALSLLSSYRLNRLEFFPRIRELEFVGNGLGMYDSTGVYVSGGDYDYVFITSEEGTLSTEINASLGLYCKPGQALKGGLWDRMMYDALVQGTEQSTDIKGIGQYFFLPGSAFDPEHTLYGRQGINQNLRYEIVKSKVNGLLSHEFSRTMDFRFQEESRQKEAGMALELEIRQFWENNLRFRIERRDESDSRYASEISQSLGSIRLIRNLNSATALQLETEYIDEQGEKSGTQDTFTLTAISISSMLRSVWLQKYRMSISGSIRSNAVNGNQFLSYLPEKHEGVGVKWGIQGSYRINQYSSASLEYNGNSLPKQGSRHQLRIEFKAEL